MNKKAAVLSVVADWLSKCSEEDYDFEINWGEKGIIIQIVDGGDNHV